MAPELAEIANVRPSQLGTATQPLQQRVRLDVQRLGGLALAAAVREVGVQCGDQLAVPDPQGYTFSVRLQGEGETVFHSYPGHRD